MTQIYLHGLGQTPASWDPLLPPAGCLEASPQNPLNPHKEVPL